MKNIILQCISAMSQDILKVRVHRWRQGLENYILYKENTSWSILYKTAHKMDKLIMPLLLKKEDYL